MDIGFLQDCLITESNNIYKAQKRMENNNKPKTRKATQADFDLL